MSLDKNQGVSSHCLLQILEATPTFPGSWPPFFHLKETIFKSNNFASLWPFIYHHVSLTTVEKGSQLSKTQAIRLSPPK